MDGSSAEENEFPWAALLIPIKAEHIVVVVVVVVVGVVLLKAVVKSICSPEHRGSEIWDVQNSSIKTLNI